MNHKTPYPLKTLHERLVKDKAVDMRDNFKISDLADGYVKITPINKDKLYK